MSGNYVLKFEAVGPPAVMLLTSPPFTVINPIARVGMAPNDAWSELEIDSFQSNVTVPRNLRFQVAISGGLIGAKIRQTF